MDTVASTLSPVHEKAMRGVPWTLLTYGFNRGLLFVATAVLARLLTPADFGVVALATFALLALALLSDAGIGPAIVVMDRMDGMRARTALTLVLGLGVVVAALMVATAPLMAAALDEQRLTEILRVLAIGVPVHAVISFIEAMLQRDLDFRIRFFGQAVQAVVYAAVAIGLAAAGAGIWSLVVSQVVSLTCQLLTLLALSSHRVLPGFSMAEARSLAVSGRTFMAQSWLVFISQNVDYLLVGKLLGARALGFYSMAFRISSLTYFAVAEPVTRATFPAFARMREAGEDYRPVFLTSLRLIGLVTAPFGLVLSGAAEPLTRAVLGDQWLPMVGALTALGVMAAVRPVHAAAGWLLNATGAAGAQAKLQAASLVVLVPAVALAADSGDIRAVGWVLTGWFVLQWLGVSLIARRMSGITLSAQAGALAPVLVGALPCWIAARATTAALDGEPAVLALAAATLAGFAGYAAGVLLTAPDVPRWVADQVRSMLGRTAVPAPEPAPPGRA